MKAFISAIALVSLLLSAPVSFAAGGETDEKPSNRTVDLNGLVLPVEKDGRLINYLFISARLTIADGHNHWKYREQGHIIRDAILKEAHRTPFGKPGAPMELDHEKATERIKIALQDVMEADAVASVEFVTVDSLKIFSQSSAN